MLGSSGGTTSGDPSKGPAWGRERGGAFFLSVRTGSRREGEDAVAPSLGAPDPLPSFPPAAALLAARGPEELLCFTERLEDLVCFWEEAASAGVGPDNYSFFYQLE